MEENEKKDEQEVQKEQATEVAEEIVKKNIMDEMSEFEKKKEKFEKEKQLKELSEKEILLVTELKESVQQREMYVKEANRFIDGLVCREEILLKRLQGEIQPEIKKLQKELK